MCNWLGMAWEELKKKHEEEGVFRKYFERTGCLMDNEGKYDHLIRIEGLPRDWYKSIEMLEAFPRELWRSILSQ